MQTTQGRPGERAAASSALLNSAPAAMPCTFCHGPLTHTRVLRTLRRGARPSEQMSTARMRAPPHGSSSGAPRRMAAVAVGAPMPPTSALPSDTLSCTLLLLHASPKESSVADVAPAATEGGGSLRKVNVIGALTHHFWSAFSASPSEAERPLPEALKVAIIGSVGCAKRKCASNTRANRPEAAMCASATADARFTAIESSRNAATSASGTGTSSTKGRTRDTTATNSLTCCREPRNVLPALRESLNAMPWSSRPSTVPQASPVKSAAQTQPCAASSRARSLGLKQHRTH
mmetsp:Transcript_65136/g.190567  ORF Transcript_65136/g.190567 Transcript_65136/m.190567 type:complete len:290 (-) Transcript_65136:101-970(-)